MSITPTLSLVRQVQSIAESPELLQARNGLADVASFLDSFLDHSDSSARLAAARTLAWLSNRYEEQWKVIALIQAPCVLEGLDKQAAESVLDAEASELRLALACALGSNMAEGQIAPPVSDKSCSRSEVRIQVQRISLSSEAKDAICRAIIAVGGVVSVTFEADTVVVCTRTPQLASDPIYVEDLCMTVEEYFANAGNTHAGSKPLVTPLNSNRFDAGSDTSEDSEEPAYLDEGDSDISGGAADEPAYLDDDEDELVYLDDEEDTDGKAWELKPWSFFNTSGWFAQRLQEYEEDPTLVARLRKAQERMERRKREEKARVSRVLGVITPLRRR